MPTVELNGRRQFFLDEGDGRVVLFVHGFPLDHSMWDGQRRGLRDRFRVVIPDLRGFGRSELTGDSLTLADLADDLAALLDHIGAAGPIVYCGLSMGGYIAFEFARRHRARLEKLILCDTRALPDSPEQAAARLTMVTTVLTEGPRLLVEMMLPRLFGPQTNEDHPEIVDQIRNTMLATSSRTIAAAQRMMANRPDSTDLLPLLDLPTLVLVGEHDLISPASEMRAIAEALPQGQFVQIPGIGHMAPLEAPDAVNAALLQFLG